MMEFLKYGAVCLLAIGAIAIFICAVKGGKPLKALALNAFARAAVFALINLTTHFTGVHIPLNQWTAAGAVCYGVPAVCAFLLLPLIMK